MNIKIACKVFETFWKSCKGLKNLESLETFDFLKILNGLESLGNVLGKSMFDSRYRTELISVLFIYDEKDGKYSWKSRMLFLFPMSAGR